MAAAGADAGGGPRRRRSSGPRRRRDPDATRADLLGAGRQLVTRRSLGPTLGHLRVNDLAKAGGVTSGAFYHYWDGQDAYRADLLAALLEGPRLDATGDLFVCPTDGRPAERFDRAVRGAAERLADDPAQRLELALWAHDDPEANRGLLARLRHTDAVWAVALGELLAARRRRPVEGWTLAGLATAAVALSDGLRIQHLADPTVLGVGTADPWPPPSTLALLLLLGATRAGEPDPVPARPGPLPPGPAAEAGPRQRRLLDLGVEAARVRPTGNALDHIRADDVVAHLDLTIGAFYHHWDTQDDYRDDLVDALFAADRYVDPAAVASRAAMVGEAAPGLTDAVRDATSWYWSVAAGHPDNRLQLGFLALDDPFITPRLAAEAVELAGAWDTVVQAVLDHADRRLRAPLDTGLVVLGMSAALDGFVVRHGLDPAGLGPDDEGWTAWGRTCLALLTAASAPVGDDRDLAATAEDELPA